MRWERINKIISVSNSIIFLRWYLLKLLIEKLLIYIVTNKGKSKDGNQFLGSVQVYFVHIFSHIQGC